MTKDNQSCCTPARKTGPRPTGRTFAPARSADDFATVHIGEGRSFIGTDTPEIPDDGESPFRKARHKAFMMAETVVTNAQFKEFIDATGYVTEAERFGWSFVFWSDVAQEIGPTAAYVGAEWWRRVEGAHWRAIDGPGTLKTLWQPDHPVVQVSWHDAQAYAQWVGGRLPTEIEWEAAARGSLGDVPFTWGTRTPDEDAHFPCNIWQGQFPETNTGADGYERTAPATAFPPNALGLYNMLGNVWEWTADPFRIKSMKKQVRARMAQMQGYRLAKGGSYLCHRSYCYRYRIAARSGSSPDSATPHQGFRVVWDVR